MKTMRKQSGFTLIELMIVVAILAILMAIAIPAYQDYTIRAQVSEGMNLAGGARTSVAEYYTDKGSWPADNDEAGLAASTDITGEYVTEVEVSNGIIEVSFGNGHSKITGDTLGLSPTSAGGSIAWESKASSAAPTSIEPKYLPARCR